MFSCFFTYHISYVKNHFSEGNLLEKGWIRIHHPPQIMSDSFFNAWIFSEAFSNSVIYTHKGTPVKSSPVLALQTDTFRADLCYHCPT